MRLLLLASLSATAIAATPEPEIFGQLPIYFEPNRGQAPSSAQFLARGGGITMLVGDRETVLATRGKPVTMSLEGSRRAKLEGLEPVPGVSNYFHGNDPAKWLTAVPHFAKVAARGVYQGIDIVYYGNPRRIEYDFVLAPGAHPGVIRLAYRGADKIRLDDRGDLVLSTGAGELRQHKPLVYQEVGGHRVEVAASYTVRGAEVGFELARYDRSQPLVIDPALSYGSVLGGSDYDYGVGIGLDSTGAIYVAGITLSPDFPKQAPIDSLLQAYEVFVTKLTPDGKSLVYSTYVGGGRTDLVTGLAVQPSGNVFIAGSTDSSDFPASGGFQTALSGTGFASPPDAFVAKLSPTGTLVYGTYLGGSGNDIAFALTVDTAGNAYVAGSTDSPGFPGSTSAAEENAFVSKIGPAGNTLSFTMILGGNQPDQAYGIAVDPSGIYVTGHTWSANFPVTPGVFQPTLTPITRGSPDAFVTKVKLDGSGLLYSTYLGLQCVESRNAIAIDAVGNAYVTGSQAITPFTLDVFALKLNSTGTAPLYTARLGAGDFNYRATIAVDSSGRAIVGGQNLSTGLPLIAAWQSSLAGGFLARFNPTGTATEYSTYLGNSVSGVFVDSSGATWVTGTLSPGCCGADTLLMNGYDITPNGSSDAYIAKFIDQPPPVSVTIASNPPGRTVFVDQRVVTTPATQIWQPGSTHTLDANAPQVANATVYQFGSWSHGGAASQSFIAGDTSTYTVTYTPVPCTYTLSLTSFVAGFQGTGPTHVTVTTRDICPWTARSNAAWLAPVTFFDSGTGSRFFDFQVDPNLGPPRSATITVGNATLTVTQAGGSGGLPAPALNTPPSPVTFQTRPVALSWAQVPGAAAYDIRLLKSLGSLTLAGGMVLQTFYVIHQTSQMGASATSTTIDLPTGGYLFFVRACRDVPSDAVCGSFAATQINVNLTAPQQVPAILSPSGTLTSSTQEFRWSAVPGAERYQVTLVDDAQRIEYQINTPATSTIYSLRGAPSYTLRVAACQAACGPAAERQFATNLAPIPTAAPANLAATPLSPTSYKFTWTPVTGADIYRLAVVQPNSGPGGGALTVASNQTAIPELPLRVPPGPASVIVAACTGRGCGPYSPPLALNPPGPAPTAPVIGQPISVTNVDGPVVLFTWSRVPGDNGSNTTYRLYSADLSRNAAALDVQTTNNFYAALFTAEGRRYDAVVAANPGPSQTLSAPVGFIVQGTSSTAPTPTSPTHEGTVKQGDVALAWTPVPDATFYQYAVFKTGDTRPTMTGITPGLLASVQLTAQGAGTKYSVILRACPLASFEICKPDSDAGWGPWSNAPGGPGVANFTTVP
ncbi:MAG: SBBP repeat-containing protein [Bryobacteraceae bacterium]